MIRGRSSGVMVRDPQGRDNYDRACDAIDVYLEHWQEAPHNQQTNYQLLQNIKQLQGRLIHAENVVMELKETKKKDNLPF